MCGTGKSPKTPQGKFFIFCLYICVWVCLRGYVRAYVRVCVYTYVQAHVHVCARVYKRPEADVRCPLQLLSTLLQQEGLSMNPRFSHETTLARSFPPGIHSLPPNPRDSQAGAGDLNSGLYICRTSDLSPEPSSLSTLPPRWSYTC